MPDEIMIKVKNSINNTDAVSQPVVDPMLTGFFRINNSDITNKDKAKLEEISEYVSEYGDEKLDVLRDLRFRMGHPSMGVSEIDHFHKYIRVRNSIKRQEQELKAMER